MHGSPSEHAGCSHGKHASSTLSKDEEAAHRMERAKTRIAPTNPQVRETHDERSATDRDAGQPTLYPHKRIHKRRK